MTVAIVVLVSDHNDPGRGEITLLDDPRDAERMIEELLEAGYEQERIRVFDALEVEMQVRHRPVVSLFRPQPEPAFAAGEDGVEADGADGEEAEGTPFVRNGVRFSSLFRPA